MRIDMNYNESLGYLEQLSVFGMRLGLERMRELLASLGNPQDSYRTAHITGTNGKGSVTVMLSGILSESGFKTGMYTSPHLSSYLERMQINGKMVSEENFASVLSEVRRSCDEMVAKGSEQPTQFEVLTAAAFLLFSREKVDYAVIEVGLGGLLDSTNVITPKVSVITNVALDHADKCDGTLSGIAKHKAGIIKSGVPVVTGATGDALDIIREKAEQEKADVYVLGDDFSVAFDRADLLHFSGYADVMGDIYYRLGMKGLYQADNSAIAVAAAMVLAVGELSITEASVRHAMAKAMWPCRFELLTGAEEKFGHKILLDGAHNSAGALMLRESLDFYFPAEKRVFLLGVLADKDFAKVLYTLLRPQDTAVFTAPYSERAADPNELMKLAKTENKESFADPEEALSRALALADGNSILICAGSLYLVGALRDMILKRY